MDKDIVEEFRKKHIENYKNAVLETLKNNTISLFFDDILSLLDTPPLDSMDIIKCKFLDLAKRYKIVIQAEALDKILNSYRKKVVTYISSWEKMRIEQLQEIILSFSPKRESDVIKINKKDFSSLNRKLKRTMKVDISDVIDKKIVKNVNLLFTKDTDKTIVFDLSNEMIKFVTSTYVKQILESIDFKIIVKDTTLINGIREQGERFLFTNMNSYLLNDNR